MEFENGIFVHYSYLIQKNNECLHITEKNKNFKTVAWQIQAESGEGFGLMSEGGSFFVEIIVFCRK